ncbi:MAG: hypothetical protein R6V83_13090 [Candidatus Thorarchaeota archaeon]
MEQITHEPTSNHMNWNESYYFLFYDKKTELGLMNRVGFKPNKPEGMTFLFLFLPDGSVAAFHTTDECESYPNSLDVAGVSHQPKPDGTWEYSFDGSLVVVEDSEQLPKARERPELISDLLESHIQLSFDPLNKPYEYSEHMTPESLELGRKSGDKHWEQIATISGSIELGENRYSINSVIGQRDHTHGIRDWTGVGNWFYFVVWFDENLAVNPAAVVAEDGSLATGGFIFREGENVPLTSIEVISHEFRADGVFPTRTELELKDNEKNIYRLIGEPGPIVPVPFTDSSGRESVLVQSFGKFELDNRLDGYGSYETLRRFTI